MTRLITALGFALALIFLNAEKTRADEGPPPPPPPTVQGLLSACTQTFHSGNASEYILGVNKGFCWGYIAGVAATIGPAGLACVGDPTTGKPPPLRAMEQAFTNWAQKHPEAWSKQEAAGVTEALRETWPCPRK